jgi:hypothetical protein
MERAVRPPLDSCSRAFTEAISRNDSALRTHVAASVTLKREDAEDGATVAPTQPTIAGPGLECPGAFSYTNLVISDV